MGAVLLVGACSSRDSMELAALQSSKVVAIEVMTSLAGVNKYILDNTPPEQIRAEATSALKEVLARDFIGYPGGTKRVKMIVSLTEIRMATAGSRQLAGYDSRLSGSVRIVDERDGSLIAEGKALSADETGLHISSGGNIAFVVAGLAANAMVNSVANAEVTDHALAVKAAEAFSKRVKTWFTPSAT